MKNNTTFESMIAEGFTYSQNNLQSILERLKKPHKYIDISIISVEYLADMASNYRTYENGIFVITQKDFDTLQTCQGFDTIFDEVMLDVHLGTLFGTPVVLGEKTHLKVYSVN